MDRPIFKSVPVAKDCSIPFEGIVATIIQPSVIAIACGMKDAGVPNILGTAFGVRPLDGADQTDFYVTCCHVINELISLKNTEDIELAKYGLKDNETYIAISKTDGNGNCNWEWRKVEKYGLKSLSTLEMDVSVFKIDGVVVPSLNLSENAAFLGSEVGVLGFPTEANLQDSSIQPFVIKTILSSILNYKFKNVEGPDEKGDLVKKDVVLPRLALAHPLASGFSGSPVFSIQDECTVLGVVDYTPFVEDEFYTKHRSKDGHVFDSTIYGQYPTFTSFAIPSKHIIDNLNMYKYYREMATRDGKKHGFWIVPRKQEPL